MGLKHWWKTGAAPNDYEFGLAHETFEGQPVAYLRSIVRPVRGFAAFCQTIADEDYRGKRIRFSAALKVLDYAKWIRAASFKAPTSKKDQLVGVNSDTGGHGLVSTSCCW